MPERYDTSLRRGLLLLMALENIRYVKNNSMKLRNIEEKLMSITLI